MKMKRWDSRAAQLTGYRIRVDNERLRTERALLEYIAPADADPELIVEIALRNCELAHRSFQVY